MSKKNKDKPYPRETTVTHENTPLVSGELKVEYDKGVIIIRDRNGKALDFGSSTMTKTYLGQNKKKTVSQIDGLDRSFVDVSDVVSYFDFIFAIDTNTTIEMYDDFYIGVGFASYCRADLNNDMFSCRPYMSIDWYASLKDNLELHSWKVVIEHLQSIIPHEKKVAVVVDSEYGKLGAFNRRTEPIVYDWYLPENYFLIFATADNKDDWCNRAIKYCDQNANLRKSVIIMNPKDKNDPTNGYSIKGYISFLDEITI